MQQKIKSEITKNKILTAAEKEFSEKGLAAARVDSIAENAGVNKRLIYSHFQSKEILYEKVLEKVYMRLADYEEVLKNIEFTGIASIREMIIEYFEFLYKNPSFVRLVLWENLNYGKNSSKIHTTLFFGAEELLKKGIQKGVIKKDIDVKETSMSINMFCFSAFSNTYTISKHINKELNSEEYIKNRANHIADVIIEYLKI